MVWNENFDCEIFTVYLQADPNYSYIWRMYHLSILHEYSLWLCLVELDKNKQNVIDILTFQLIF